MNSNLPRETETRKPDEVTAAANVICERFFGTPALRAFWLGVLCAAVFLQMLLFGYKVGKDFAERENRRDCIAAGGSDCG